MPRRPYDEDAELTRYVLAHYSHLATPREQQVLRSILLNAKARNASAGSSMRRRLEHMALGEDLQPLSELAAGDVEAQRKVRDRILADHSDAVFVNRCSQCQRIVETPLARQCLWCGHDWHPRHG